MIQEKTGIRDAGATREALGETLRCRGDLDGAEACLRRALEERAADGDDPHDVETASSLVNLASLLDARGSPREALALMQRAAHIFETELDPRDPNVDVARKWLGYLEEKVGGDHK